MPQIAKSILSHAVIVKSEVSATNTRQRTSITEAIISKKDAASLYGECNRSEYKPQRNHHHNKEVVITSRALQRT